MTKAEKRKAYHRAWVLANPEKQRLYRKVWKEANQEKIKASRRSSVSTDPKKSQAKNREYSRRRLYRLSPDDYSTILSSQNGVCAICKGQETATFRGTVKDLSVDHDHIAGKVRGLLCQRCNTGLGNFRDSPAFLSAALAYLQHGRR